jgi:hypothetical protein
VVLWAQPASASITKTAASGVRQFLTLFGPPDTSCLCGAADRLDQAAYSPSQCSLSLLFDNLIGAGEKRLRHGEAERLGGLEIDDQLECGRLLDRKIGRLLAPQYPSGVNAGLAIESYVVNSIADQAAGRDKLSVRMPERPTPERCVEAYYLQRTRFESIAERKLRRGS